jgi:hypothetical protein
LHYSDNIAGIFHTHPDGLVEDANFSNPGDVQSFDEFNANRVSNHLTTVPWFLGGNDGSFDIMAYSGPNQHFIANGRPEHMWNNKILCKVFLAAAMLFDCTAIARSPVPNEIAIPLDLSTIQLRRAELHGRWVEFQTYVFRWKTRSFLIAVPGQASGETRTMCRGEAGTVLPVLLQRGYAPLRRRDLANLARQPRVLVRAIFHDTEYSVSEHWFTQNWQGFFDRATIIRAMGEWCDL